MNLAVEFEGILHRKAKGGYVNPRVLWHGPGEAMHAERLSKSCQHGVGGCLHLSGFTAPHRTCPSLQHSQDHLVPPSSFSAKSKFCLCWLSADEIPAAFTKGGSAIPYQPHTRCRVFLNHKSTFFLTSTSLLLRILPLVGPWKFSCSRTSVRPGIHAGCSGCLCRGQGGVWHGGGKHQGGHGWAPGLHLSRKI